MPYCAQCNEELPGGLSVFRQTPCPHCGEPLHACVQCRFYEPTLHNQCLEPQAEQVRDRQTANFCEFYELAGTSRSPGASGAVTARSDGPSPAADREARAREARAKLDALFKKPKE